MTLLNFVIYILWVVPILLQGAIVFGMVRRKLVKSFPVFFTYTLWVLFSTTGLLFFRPYGGALFAFECGALHWMDPIAFSIVNSASYNVAALIWAFYILLPRGGNPLDRLPNADLADWNDAFNDYVSQRSRRW